VEYATILEHFRADMEANGPRAGLQKFARKQLLSVLTNPKRFATSLKVAGLLSRFTGKRNSLPGFVAELLTGSPNVSMTLPATPEKIALKQLPECSLAIGKRRYRVGVLAGCVMRVLFHGANEATVRVLQRNGCEVIAPRTAGCCGALHLHTGYMSEAKRRARALLDALDGVKMDAFIVNSAGCGSTLKEYGEILEDDPVYAERAKAFAARVRDISEFLVEMGAEPPSGPFPATVAYHDACHLAHGQKITHPPRQLLKSVPGLQLVDLPESDTCCGSAGIYNLTQPGMARRLLERKVDFIAQTGASVVATGNPGCLAWIQQGLLERGLSIQVMHPVEILDVAYRA
jgi:glycolate oxidase iron-sulfur subunit